MLAPRNLCLAALLAVSAGAFADAGHSSETQVGTPGASGDASRTIVVSMTDNRFDRVRIDVHSGETVRFVVHNQGRLVHEFSIGTTQMHTTHQGEMVAMMQSGQMSPTTVMDGHGGHMGHDDPNAVLLNPGESRVLVWHFDAPAGDLEFACNVPGHYQAGMVGRIHVDS